jgi:NET1-associated nuclear protein 1 (U3 small nucleolar RNA-associated protein 17)
MIMVLMMVRIKFADTTSSLFHLFLPHLFFTNTTHYHLFLSSVTSLKFWEYNTTSGEYVLNTKVRAPHSQLISALTFAYSPSRGKIVATASHDHKFKIWRPTTMKVGPSSVSRASKGDSSSSTAQSRVVWDCHSVGFYRDMPITDATLSGDGSILAVAYSNIVTLWSPLDNMLQHTLPHPHGKDDKGVTSVSFVGGSPLLVTTTDDDIYVWNLLTCDVIWELRGVKPLMVCCTSGTSWKDTSRIALLTNHTSSKRVLLFNAMISTPIYSWSIPDGIKPMSVWFEAKSGGGHRSSESDSLLLVSENVQLYQLHQNSVSSSSTSTNATLLSGTQNLSNFERMFGQRKGGVTGSGGSGGTFLHQHHNDHDMVLVDGPSHVVASVSSLFDSFMRQSAGEDAVIVKSTRNQEELLEKYATPSATATAAVNTFSNSVAAQEDIVVAQEEGMVQFDTASEEMMLEWFSKDGELLEPSSKKVLKKAALKSSSKKKRVAADSKKTTTRKSKRLRK